jgi:hypothetical protein
MSRALAATQRGARRVSTAVAWRVRRPWAWARHRAVAADCALWVDGMANRGRDYVRADLEVLARDTMRKAVGDRP